MENTYNKRFTRWNKKIWRVEKIYKRNNKVLTYNLREMEEDNLLIRKIYPEVPPKVEYSLTETGYSLKPILESMDKWGVNYREKTKYE